MKTRTRTAVAISLAMLGGAVAYAQIDPSLTSEDILSRVPFDVFRPSRTIGSLPITPSIVIDTPADDPHEEDTDDPLTVSGVTTETVTSVTYNIDGGGEQACTIPVANTFSCDVDLDVGLQTVTVTANGTSGSGQDTIVVEYEPDPTITITVPASDPQTTTTVVNTVSGTTTNTIDSVTYRIGAGAETACTTGVGTFSCSVTLEAGGNNTITVTANGPLDSATDTVVLNFPAPTITVTTPATDPFSLAGTSTTVSGTTTNNVSTVTYRIGAGSEVSCSTGVGTFSCSVTGLSVIGNNTITVTATSELGTTGTDTQVLDYQPNPTVTITSPATDPFTSTSSPQTVSGTTTNTISSVTYRIGAGGENACSTGTNTFSCSVTLSAVGNNTITVTANGPLASATDTVVLDYQPPTTITITVPSADPSAVSGSPATVSGTTTGTVNSVSWSTSEGSGSCTTGSGTFSCSVTSSLGDGKTVTVTADGPTNPDGTDTTVLNFPTFDLTPGSTTPNDLSDSLTVNSTSMTLVFSCTAADISGTNMACRDASTGITFAEDSSGTAPAVTTLNPFHAFDSNERGVNFNSTGKYYSNANENLWANGDDIVLEVIYRAGSTSNRALLGNATGTGAKGVSLTTTSSAVTMRVGDGTTNLTQASSANSGVGTYVHALAWIDDSTDFGVCISGTCSTNSNIGTVGDWSAGGTEFGLGSFADASNTYASQIVAWRAWKCSGCMSGSSNSTEMASIAFSRIGTAFGMKPNIVAGSAAPTTMTRAATGSVDVVHNNSRHIYRYAEALPRDVRRTSSGTAFNGYLSEPQTTNLALQSQVLGTTWTAVTAGDNVLTDQLVSPEVYNAASADGIDGHNSDAEHGVTQNITLTATNYTFSAFAFSGSQTVVALRTGIANTTTYFDLSTCAGCTAGQDCPDAVGTTGSAVLQARAQRWPVDTNEDGTPDNEYCRISISYTGTAASHAHTLLCASSDNDATYNDANATRDCGFWQAQVEAFPAFTSTIVTTTASVTRSADDVRYSGTSHYTGSPATLAARTQCPNFDVATSSTVASVGTGSTNNATVGINATDDRMQTIGANAGAQWDISAGSGDVADGTEHPLRVVMATNDIEGFDGTTSAGTDGTATLPTSASSFLYLGTKGGTAEQAMCPIIRVRLWSVKASPTVAP